MEEHRLDFRITVGPGPIESALRISVEEFLERVAGESVEGIHGARTSDRLIDRQVQNPYPWARPQFAFRQVRPPAPMTAA